MLKSYTHNYTPEKLALQSRRDVETIRHNALHHGASDLIEMCDRDLEQRVPAKTKKSTNAHSKSSGRDVVTGYHFVCERNRGVTEVGDGSFRSGSWVVAEENVKDSLKYGAYLALHESKSELSYRQGQIVNYRRSPRDMLGNKEAELGAKTHEGIEFLVKETNQPYAWVGDGAGEKGYRWSKLAQTSASQPASPEVASP